MHLCQASARAPCARLVCGTYPAGHPVNNGDGSSRPRVRRAAAGRSSSARKRSEFVESERWRALAFGQGEVDHGDEAPLTVACWIGEPLGDDPPAGLLAEREELDRKSVV